MSSPTLILREWISFLKEPRHHPITFLIWTNNTATSTCPVHVLHGRPSYFSQQQQANSSLKQRPSREREGEKNKNHAGAKDRQGVASPDPVEGDDWLQGHPKDFRALKVLRVPTTAGPRRQK